MIHKKISYIITVLLSFAVFAQAEEPADSIGGEQELNDVVVTAASSIKSQYRVENTSIIGQSQLIRAACCNLGESFVNNPSVDVSYSDAATGAKQIKLLGLSGTYVQMLTENIPNLRGGSIPYSLSFVPGPWMQSIQVSNGAASVKNGYESTTGQINIEFLKPQSIDGVRGNLFLDSNLKYELNADGSIHLNDRLSTSLLLHYEDRRMDHDGNDDGFMDMPKQRQYNVMHRWAYLSPKWISQLSMRVLKDERESGMSKHHTLDAMPRYGVEVNTNRYEFQWKNGFTLDAEKNRSVALMVHGSLHDADNHFGNNIYDFRQTNGYAQLMYETDMAENHNWAIGASVNHDYYDEMVQQVPLSPEMDKETTPGAYAQYTYKLDTRLSVMAGVRWDHSSLYGGFFTPRLHLKFTPKPLFTLRASAGKGYRTPHALAENTPMLASGRTFYIADDLEQEEAWNYGLSVGFNIPICGKKLELNGEYYYTDFVNQMVVNVDGAKGEHTVCFENLDGESYSHTLQVDATYPFFRGFSATGAFRYNDARTTYDGRLKFRPLTSRFKGLLTFSYKWHMDLWQFDLTGQANGRGKLYDYSDYPTYYQLQAQLTREFRHFSIYVGGENLTNYKMSTPIIEAHQPWSPAFDATQVWGPTEGAMAYIGVRFKFEKD